jgi:rSAM/selenodomain-associated transferase 1
MAIGPAHREAVQVAVFAKAPVPGLAKTRLAATLGPAGAARLQRRLTLRALSTALAAAIGPVSLWCAPDTRHRFFRALSRVRGLPCRAQEGDDLGERMGACFRTLLPQGPTLLMGTDCPDLTPERLRTAADRLRHVDAFLYPAIDGGYVLLGLRRLHPTLFEDIPWGAGSVMEETRLRLAALGWAWEEGDPLHDIDEIGDLIHLPPGLLQPQVPRGVGKPVRAVPETPAR